MYRPRVLAELGVFCGRTLAEEKGYDLVARDLDEAGQTTGSDSVLAAEDGGLLAGRPDLVHFDALVQTLRV